jgi:predicted MPP superfamily phosphohydrolase
MGNLKSKLRSKTRTFLLDNRRTLITAAGSALLSGVAVYLYAAKVEARNYKLERVHITTEPDARPNGSVGGKQVKLRILHLSDLHLASPESHKIDFLQKITDAEYDMIIFTGDIFENYSGTQYAKDLIVRKPRLGAYAVLGNHDYYDYTWFHKTLGRVNRQFRHPRHKRDVSPLVNSLQESGITVLRNSSRLMHDEHTCLVGIDYPGITPEELQALTSQAPPGYLVLAMLHLPRRLHQLPQAGVHVAFAGHTHGGQIRMPGYGALITDSELPRKEASGLVRRDKTVIHVSRGLGADPKTNFRLFCPPAATIIEISHNA